MEEIKKLTIEIPTKSGKQSTFKVSIELDEFASDVDEFYWQYATDQVKQSILRELGQ